MEPPSSNGRAPLNGPGPFFPEPGHGAGFEQEFEIIVIDSRWRSHVPRLESVVRRAVMAACRQLTDAGDGPETVVLTSDREVKRLNARHRGRNKPTNVLTFEPMPGYPGGEIVLGLEIVCREARAASRSVAAHLSHLIVHGMLHLEGFDHEQAGDARRMEMEEARILSTIGVPNPWKPGYGRHGL